MSTPTAKKTQASLCSGYGGLDMALDGILRWYAENNPDAARVMKREHPEAPNLEDMTEADWRKVEPVDLLTMGLPCQPVANPGKGLVAADARWLWPHARNAVRTIRPQEVFLENVEGLVSATWVRGAGERGEVFRSMLADFVVMGYAVRWMVLGACMVGACHHRHRVFLHAQRVQGPAPVAERLGTGRWCGAPRTGGRLLLPALTFRDGDPNQRGEGSADFWTSRMERRSSGLPLGAVVQLLPTPAAWDGLGGSRDRVLGGVRLSGAKRAITLGTAVRLLPTPEASDSSGGRRAKELGGTRPSGAKRAITLGTAVYHWDRYADGVATWEERFRPAPLPTEANTRGGRRLAAAFPEWMMGLPEGFLTSEMGRPEAIQRAGNGVMPQAAELAYRMLTS